jgi:hypothetical protein
VTQVTNGYIDACHDLATPSPSGGGREQINLCGAEILAAFVEEIAHAIGLGIERPNDVCVTAMVLGVVTIPTIG